MATVPKKYIGVAISDFSDDGLTALKWAVEFLKLPLMYKLCIIRIKKQENSDPCENGSELNWEQMEESFVNVADEDRFEVFQGLAGKFGHQNVVAKICQGTDNQEALQYAIDNMPGLEMLVLGCAGPNGGWRTTPQIMLQLSGCSVVLAKIEPGAKKTLSLSAPVAAPPLSSQLPPAMPEGPSRSQPSGAPLGDSRRPGTRPSRPE